MQSDSGLTLPPPLSPEESARFNEPLSRCILVTIGAAALALASCILVRPVYELILFFMASTSGSDELNVDELDLFFNILSVCSITSCVIFIARQWLKGIFSGFPKALSVIMLIVSYMAIGLVTAFWIFGYAYSSIKEYILNPEGDTGWGIFFLLGDALFLGIVILIFCIIGRAHPFARLSVLTAFAFFSYILIALATFLSIFGVLILVVVLLLAAIGYAFNHTRVVIRS